MVCKMVVKLVAQRFGKKGKTSTTDPAPVKETSKDETAKNNKNKVETPEETPITWGGSTTAGKWVRGVAGGLGLLGLLKWIFNRPQQQTQQ